MEILSPTTNADDDARAIEMWRLVGDVYELVARPTGALMVSAEPFPGLTLTDIWP